MGSTIEPQVDPRFVWEDVAIPLAHLFRAYSKSRRSIAQPNYDASIWIDLQHQIPQRSHDWFKILFSDCDQVLEVCCVSICRIRFHVRAESAWPDRRMDKRFREGRFGSGPACQRLCHRLNHRLGPISARSSQLVIFTRLLQCTARRYHRASNWHPRSRIHIAPSKVRAAM